MTNVYFQMGLAVGIVALILSIALMQYAKKSTSTGSLTSTTTDNSTQANASEKKKRWEFDFGKTWSYVGTPVIIIGVLIAANLLIKEMLPWLWQLISKQVYVLNLAIGGIMFLQTLRARDESGKKTKEPHPVAAMGTSILVVLLVLTAATMAWQKYEDSPVVAAVLGKSRTTDKTYVVGDVSDSKFNIRDVPESDKELDRILDGIGKIESGNQHIDPKTGAPMRNKEGSSAIGELQIMESLHSERANALGYDIRTREGNRGYGKHLLKTLGTTPWEVDPRSFGKLVSQVGLYRPKSQFATRERIYALVALDPDKWSDPVPVINQPGIYGRYIFSWVATFTEGKGEARECQVAFNGRTDRPFPFRDYVEDEHVGKKESFQYLCKEKATVTVRLVPPA